MKRTRRTWYFGGLETVTAGSREEALELILRAHDLHWKWRTWA